MVCTSQQQICKKKLAEWDSLSFSFPPMFNFISEEDITIDSSDDNDAEVFVIGNGEKYIFKITKSDENDYGMIIDTIYLESRWSGLLPIIE